MIFKRTYSFLTKKSAIDIKSSLRSNQLNIHKLNFLVEDNKQNLKIIPQAENTEVIKTLPITHVEFYNDKNQNTKVVVKSKIRRIDAGGPYIIVAFCIFITLGGGIFMLLNRHEGLLGPVIMFSIGIGAFCFFWYRMQAGYFAYIRQIKKFVKQSLA